MNQTQRHCFSLPVSLAILVHSVPQRSRFAGHQGVWRLWCLYQRCVAMPVAATAPLLVHTAVFALATLCLLGPNVTRIGIHGAAPALTFRQLVCPTAAVWWAVAAGVGVSIIFGVIFISIYYTAQNNLFKGKNRDWFKGIISWIAAVLITILGFAMLRFLGWEEKWKRRLNAALADRVS